MLAALTPSLQAHAAVGYGALFTRSTSLTSDPSCHGKPGQFFGVLCSAS